MMSCVETLCFCVSSTAGSFIYRIGDFLVILPAHADWRLEQMLLKGMFLSIGHAT